MVAGSTSGPENQNKPQLFLTPLVHTRANRNLRPPIGIADFYRSPLFTGGAVDVDATNLLSFCGTAVPTGSVNKGAS